MNESTDRRPRRRANIAFVGFLIVAGYLLWSEHRVHFVEALPWLLLLGCVAMHLFMHGGHGRGSTSDANRESAPTPRRDEEPR